MAEYLEIFRLNMKYYREKLGISWSQLSIICDCGTGTIGGIESGKAKPSFDMLIKIADKRKHITTYHQIERLIFIHKTIASGTYPTTKKIAKYLETSTATISW